MKAVWYVMQGSARQVLHVGEQPTPSPAAGEVRVRLHASAVNPADANRRAGRGHRMEFPVVIPNSDGAGVIDAIGSGVSQRRVGERVWLYFGQRGRPFGTAAEYICLDASLTLPLPEHMSFGEGACLGIPAITAYNAVLGDGDVNGQTVLVTGGAGAVGHYAVQIAKWAGAKVIATVSGPLKAERALQAGATAAIDYTKGDAGMAVLDATGGVGVDRIVDVDAGVNMELGLAAAAPNAVWVSYAVGHVPQPALPLARLVRKCITLRCLYIPALTANQRGQAQHGVQRWIGEARDAIHAIDSVYSLPATADAHERVESNMKIGTVIVECKLE